MYPPGKAYQRSEDRAQCNIDDSAVTTPHACNDIGYAAAVLLEKKYEVLLRDYQTEKTTADEVKKEVRDFLPDVIVISITNATIFSDIEFVNWISTFHKCEFVLKGAMFFEMPKEAVKNFDLHNIKYLIGGEIETVIADLIGVILRGEGNIGDVPGIVYRDGDDYVRTDNKWLCDLDEIPFPARNLMKNELYVRPDTGEPMATIQVAKGCPSNCTYCLTPIISGNRVRRRSVGNIFAEIQECYYKYGIKNFFFKADTFTIDADWATDLCDRIINSELHGKVEFTVNSRSKPLNEALLKKLKKAGCFTFAIGFETCNDETLRRIKKGTTAEDNFRAAEMVKAAGIPLLAYFMIGFPWESRQDISETLKNILKIDPDFVEIHIAMPYYGTQLYRQCEEYKTLNGDAWGKDYFAPNTIGTQSVALEDIIKMKKKCLLKFYLRPKYIIKKIGGCCTKPIVVKNYIKYGLRLLRNNIRN